MKNATLIGTFAGAVAGVIAGYLLKKDKAVGLLAGAGVGLGAGFLYDYMGEVSAVAAKVAGQSSSDAQSSFPVEGVGFGVGGGAGSPAPVVLAGLSGYVRSGPSDMQAHVRARRQWQQDVLRRWQALPASQRQAFSARWAARTGGQQQVIGSVLNWGTQVEQQIAQAWYCAQTGNAGGFCGRAS